MVSYGTMTKSWPSSLPKTLQSSTCIRVEYLISHILNHLVLDAHLQVSKSISNIKSQRLSGLIIYKVEYRRANFVIDFERVSKLLCESLPIFWDW